MARPKKYDNRQPLLIKELKTPKEAFRDLRNYLAGQFVGATRDDVLLDEVLKCLFCKLYMEAGLAEAPPEDAGAFERAKHLRGVFARVRGDFSDLYQPDAELMLDPEAVCRVVDECAFSLLDSASDPIGDAFEVFVGSESRGRAGQFFTPRGVTDLLVKAVNPRPGELVIDPACGAGGFLSSVARHYLAEGLSLKKLASTVSKTFYGIDKDDYLAKLARVHVSLLSDGHPRIRCADSIALRNGPTTLRDELPKGGFDVLLTNPPFGTRIISAGPDVLRTFELGRKWRKDARTGRLEATGEVQANVPPQVLFVERCFSLLKEGGRLGMVLPESILSNKSYRHVTEYILTNGDVHAVIGMPEALFKTSGKGGTHTKTCLLVAVKTAKAERRSKTLFMAEAKWCGQDSRARTIPLNDLPAISERFAAFRENKKLTSSSRGFILERAKVVSNVLCPRYYDPELDAEIDGLRDAYALPTFGELVRDGVLEVSTGDELGKLAYGTGEIPFVRTSDISNWEVKADPKHGVDRKLFESLKRKQDVRVHDLLMVKDGTYLIGTCAIITERDTEIIFQSHLYKIRVRPNDRGINPFLLLATLSAPFVQRQIRSKQFTQDIIDSLGERIQELVLPIAKDAALRDRVTAMVKTAVQKRAEARELAREARLAVGC